VGHCYAWQVWVPYFIYFICIHILMYFSAIYFTMHWYHFSTKSSSQPEQLHRFLIAYNRAVCESWPTSFPRFYFHIYSMNTYPINMKQPDSENYWLDLSINNAETFLFWPDSQNFGIILYFYLQWIAPMNSFQKLFLLNLLDKYSCYK